jgi:hypothetical protein
MHCSITGLNSINIGFSQIPIDGKVSNEVVRLLEVSDCSSAACSHNPRSPPERQAGFNLILVSSFRPATLAAVHAPALCTVTSMEF